MQMRSVHRVLSILVVLFTLYLGATGSLIEIVDFDTIITRPSPFDPNQMAMREDFAGPDNFRVLGVADNVAPVLPAHADLRRMMQTVTAAARRQFGTAPFKFVELRMAATGPVGQVQTDRGTFRFDAVSGGFLGAAPAMIDESRPPVAFRNTIKHLHRMTSFGNWALWINIFVSISLATLIVTGIVMYWRVLKVRRKIRRPNPFWVAGGWWRSLHRSISMACALFLTVITLSGAWLAFESLYFGYYLEQRPTAFADDASSPLADRALPAMLDATIDAFHRADPGAALRVIRLRHYGTWSQGVIITDGSAARQLVFDTASGRRLSLTEPGYPPTGFPFGWQAHQWAKSIHRGDFFGLTGRVTSLVAGLAMIYLSISGIVLYWTMWQRRRTGGRGAFFWT